jgi:hypothetical protein
MGRTNPVMRRLLLILLLLISVNAVQAQTDTPTPTATATLPFCSTPGPATQTYEEEVLETEPIVYWRLDETAGTVAIDSTGNGRHGVISGATLNSTTFLDGSPAPSFDGINDYVQAFTTSLRSAFNPNAGSWQMWALGDWSLTAARYPFAIRSTSLSIFGFRKTSTANLVGFVGGASASATIANSADWRHVVLTWDSAANTVNVYWDNALLLSSTYSAFDSTTITQINLGALDSANGLWAGNLSNSAIWNRVLTTDEIAALYSVPLSVDPTATPDCQPFNPTSTPTPNVRAYWTLPPATPGGEGQAVAFTYETDGGQMASVLFLAGILFSMWGMFWWNVLRPAGRGGGVQPSGRS